MSISEEIRASAAAHRDLGPNYDTAVAEGLVERIGEEIDRRIDARLYGQLRETPAAAAARRAPRAATPGRLGLAPVVLALGSMGLGIGATSAVLHPGGGMNAAPLAPLVALIWIVIGIVNVAYARRH